MILKHKIFFYMVCFLPLFALAEVGVFTKNAINFRESIEIKNLTTKSITTKANCTPVALEELSKHKFSAKRYIAKDSLICTKDIEIMTKEKVVFDFGAFEIEQNGKVIFENEEYIRIKKQDGSIEKIYKDGRIR